MAKSLSINLKVNANTGKITQVSDAFVKMDKRVKSAQRSMSQVKQSFVGFAATAVSGLGLNKLKEMSDEYKKLNSQVGLVTDGLAEQIVVRRELLALSNDARVGLSGTTILYAKLRRSTKDLGYSQKEILSATATISKSLTISGATAQESQSAILQLGQGLASGILRGQELNSVMEQTPRLAKLIADGMGISLGELRKVAAEGKITSKVVLDAVQSQAGTINKEFGTMATTISQANTVFGNTFLTLVGRIDEATGASNSMTESINIGAKFIANNTDLIVQGFLGIKLVFQVIKQDFFQLVVWIDEGIQSVGQGWNILTAGMQNAWKVSADAIGKIYYDVVNYVLELVSSTVNSVSSALGGAFEFVGIDNPFGDINLSIGEYTSSVKEAQIETFKLSGTDWAKSNLNDSAKATLETYNKLKNGISDATNTAVVGLNKAGEVTKKIIKPTEELTKKAKSAGKAQKAASKAATDALEKQRKAQKELHLEYLELTGQVSLVEALKLQETVEKFKEAGFSAEKLLQIKSAIAEKSKEEFDKKFSLEAPTIVAEVFNPYLNLIESQKEYMRNIREAGGDQYKIDKINSKQLSLKLKGYAGLVNGAKGFFEENSKGYKALHTAEKVLQAFEFAWFIKKAILGKAELVGTIANAATGATAVVAAETTKATAAGITAVATQAQGEPYSAWARMAAMAATIAALGIAVSGGSVSESNIEAVKGRTEFDDGSLGTIRDAIRDVDNPLLPFTKKISEGIQSIDANILGFAKQVGQSAGLNLTGTNFKETNSGGYFSSRETSLIDSNLNLGSLSFDGDVEAKINQYILTKKKSLFGLISKEKITKMSQSAGAEFNEYLSNIMSGGKDIITSSADALGYDVREKIKQYETSIGEISFKGLDEAGIQERLDGVFSEVFSGAIGSLGGINTLVEKYAQGGEENLATLVRISTEYEQTSTKLSSIGMNFSDTYKGMVDVPLSMIDRAMNAMSSYFGHSTIVASQVADFYTAQEKVLDIIKFSGGQQAFDDNYGTFLEEFYNDSEKLKFQTTKMTNSFAQLGVTMPKTNEQFRQLIESSSTFSTEAGAKTYAELLSLSDGFANMTKSAIELKDAELDRIKSLENAELNRIKSLNNISTSLIKDLVSLNTGNLSYLNSVDKLAYARKARDSGFGSAQTVAQLSIKSSANVYDYKKDFFKLEEERREEAKKAREEILKKEEIEEQRHEERMEIERENGVLLQQTLDQLSRIA